MPLGTIDRTPPPFFRQGPSALTKLVLFSALSIFLMAADSHFKLTAPLRSALATALLPVQRVLQAPVALARHGADYLQGLSASLAAENSARAELARQSEHAIRSDQLALENSQLRALLELRPALQVRSIGAEVLYEAADPFSRKLFIDRGATHGIQLGAPVINEAGVLGQVTQLYALTSLVTLLTDRDSAIPVLNTRSLQRSAAFGGAEGGGAMELRFMAGNADVELGDVLATSGVDGIYPAGLPVARVTRIERRADAGFARVLLAPVAAVDGVRHLLVLEPVGLQLPARPDVAAPAEKAEPGGRRKLGSALSAAASATAAKAASGAGR